VRWRDRVEQVCPTARSVQYQKARGYHAKIVECVNPFSRVRQDLFGADVLALKPGEPVLVVQATSGSHHSSRRSKLQDAGFVDLWKGTGAALEIWSWTHAGPRGQRKVWTLRREGL
jgi:hypothetical protein